MMLPEKLISVVAWTFVLVGVAVMLYSLEMSVTSNQLKRLTIVECQCQLGDSITLQNSLNERLKTAALSADTASIKSAVLSNYWVESVTIRNQWLAGYQVRIQERQIIGILDNNSILLSDGTVAWPGQEQIAALQLKQYPQLVGDTDTLGTMGGEITTLKESLQAYGMSIAEVRLLPSGGLEVQANNAADSNLKILLGSDDYSKQIKRLDEWLARVDTQLVEALDMRQRNGSVAVRHRTNG